MKRLLSAVLALSLALSLFACSGTEPTALRLYFPSAGEVDGTIERAVDSENYYGAEDVAALLDALMSGPSESGLKRLFSGDVRLLGWSLMGEVIQVDLSPEYVELAALDQTLAECCITLTLAQLEGVDKVRITAGGRDVPGRARRVITADDMIFSGAEEEPRQVSVELYFPRSGGRGLGFEVRELTVTENDDLYSVVTRALLTGPESSALRALFPAGTEVLDTRMDDGICYVNFSAELLDDAAADLAEQDLLLYSVVDTLGNLNGVNAVQVLVEGEAPKNYGNADTSFPLEPDFGLLARE